MAAVTDLGPQNMHYGRLDFITTALLSIFLIERVEVSLSMIKSRLLLTQGVVAERKRKDGVAASSKFRRTKGWVSRIYHAEEERNLRDRFPSDSNMSLVDYTIIFISSTVILIIGHHVDHCGLHTPRSCREPVLVLWLPHASLATC